MNLPEQPWFMLPLSESIYHRAEKPDAEMEEAITQLQALLRDEVAAAESYRSAVDKLIGDGNEPARIAAIREMQREHIRAEQIFRKRISELGGIPDDSSGPYGAWAKVVMGTAQLFGDSAALHALRDGEEHALSEMRSALKTVDSETAVLIEKVMIPAQSRHIRRIDSLLATLRA